MATKPKIAILANFPAWLYTDKLPRFSGHYAVWLVALHEAFGEQGEFEVHWVTLSKGTTAPLHFVSLNQHVHVLPRISRTVGQFTFYRHDRRQVAAALREIGPDLVHSWGTEDCYGLCAKDFKGRKLHSVQGALRAYMQRAKFPRFMHIQSWYEPRVWKSFRHMTTESPWAADRVREICPAIHPVIWEYAVEQRFFECTRAISEQPVCLYSGADSHVKNVDTLIAAFSTPELSHVTLKLAGVDPAGRPGLPDNIKALGRVGRDEMVKLLSEAWALVHMSLADTGPTIAKEARVVGLPVIISDQCGSTQHVEDGKSGYILEPHNLQGLVNAVLAATKNAETSLTMGAHGQEECRRALSANTMVNGLINIYRTVLSDDERASSSLNPQ